MPKKILITAGAVGAALDGNKIVTNRARGIWAYNYAIHAGMAGHEVTLLVPQDSYLTPTMLAALPERCVVRFSDYDSYAEQVCTLARHVDAAILAAAVTNWIPVKAYAGKMPTAGYVEGDVVHVPFKLAPRVINKLKDENPKLTLVGCKMTVGESVETTDSLAYQVLRTAHCNAVVANDRHDLKAKRLVYPDGAVREFVSFPAFYAELDAIIADEYWSTEFNFARVVSPEALQTARKRFDAVVDEYRKYFFQRGDHAFGSLAVRVHGETFLVSPRKKDVKFTADDAVLVVGVDAARRVVLTDGRKATMNAPLLVRWADKAGADVVVHLHDKRYGTVVPYAPPGTDRDNMRELPDPSKMDGFHIERHGDVFVLK